MHRHLQNPDWSGNCLPNDYRARCGYGLRKMMQEYDGASADLYSGAFAQDNNWPYFRYAEVLLNQAEAQNEALAAPDKSVYDAINEVRDRAGQPGLPEGLSKDEMRIRIHNERRVVVSGRTPFLRLASLERSSDSTGTHQGNDG